MRLINFIHEVSYGQTCPSHVDEARFQAMKRWYENNKEYALAVCKYGRKNYSENPLDWTKDCSIISS